MFEPNQEAEFAETVAQLMEQPELRKKNGSVRSPPRRGRVAVEQGWQKPFDGIRDASGQGMNDSYEVHRGELDSSAVLGPSQSSALVRQA